jgi:hypothetical protein
MLIEHLCSFFVVRPSPKLFDVQNPPFSLFYSFSLYSTSYLTIICFPCYRNTVNVVQGSHLHSVGEIAPSPNSSRDWRRLWLRHRKSHTQSDDNIGQRWFNIVASYLAQRALEDHPEFLGVFSVQGRNLIALTTLLVHRMYSF